jgi:pimeloyl-ACP methyl ester carboxylesterase
MELQMRAKDIEAVGDLAGAGLAAGGRLVQDMHEAIAGRPFAALGAGATPVRLSHDWISRGVYAAVRGALRLGPRAAAWLFARGSDPDAPPLEQGRGGSLALGALNGLYGDHLTARHNELALEMGVWRDGLPVARTPAGLAAAFPDATSRVAVFVHGLFCTEEAWRLLPLGDDRIGRRTYGERLQDELSFTPVYVRYNTGQRVSENGRALARLLDEVVAGWPTGAEEVVLVGHSMGGLVVRSACHYGEVDGGRWTDAVRHVFCLGAPHLGADLEKGLNVIAWSLGRLPETRAFERVLNARSVGIKDMRFGSCVEDDWCDCDPDEFLRDRCREVPFLPHANYYFIAATLARGPVGAVAGDLLVRIPSASGAGRHRRIPFEVDNGCRITGLNHFDLLNHPAVYEQLRTWITRTPQSSRAAFAAT